MHESPSPQHAQAQHPESAFEQEGPGVSKQPPAFQLTASNATAPVQRQAAAERPFPWKGRLSGFVGVPLWSTPSGTGLGYGEGMVAYVPANTAVQATGRSGIYLKVSLVHQGVALTGYIEAQYFLADIPDLVMHRPTSQPEEADAFSSPTLVAAEKMTHRPGEGGKVAGFAKVEPKVAIEILKNMSKGEPGWRPDLGTKGGSAFFTIEGNPFTGTDRAKCVGIDVEITGLNKAKVFKAADLRPIFNQFLAETAAEAEDKLRRSRKDKPYDAPLNSKDRGNLKKLQKGMAEERMWHRVGSMVANSKDKVGIVEVGPNNFSEQGPGKFAVVADKNKIQIKGGIPRMIQILKENGISAAPTEQAAAKEWARQKSVGKVQAVFRHAGKILIVVGVGADAYKIYTAEDKLKETATVAGGWGGAMVFSAAFATWFTPADVAGPGAWVVHGVGTLVAGGVGYFVGSETTGYLYELVVEDYKGK
jgi:hypothetical protein